MKFRHFLSITAAAAVCSVAPAVTISLPIQPGLQAAYDSSRNLLYVPYAGFGGFGVVNMSNNTVGATVNTAGQPHGIDVNADASRIAVSSRSERKVQLFDASTLTFIKEYNIGGLPSGSDHRPGELAFMANGKVLVGFQASASDTLVFKQPGLWDPTPNTFTVFGASLYEPHYVSRSSDRLTVGVFEANQNPAEGVLYDPNGTQISRNQSVPTDFSGTVPFNPGYNTIAVNDDGSAVFAGKAVYDRSFAFVTNLPQYSEPIFLSDGSIIALSNDTGSVFENWTRMSPETGAVLSSGVLPVPVSDLPGSFLVRATHPSSPANLDRIVVVDRENNRLVVFEVENDNVLPTSAGSEWSLYE